MGNASRFKRVKVTVKDVMLPFVIIIICNLIIPLSWTFISPLKYQRSPDPGTDPWNRVIETYGICYSDKSVIFASTLFAIAIVLLIIANIQAYQAFSKRIATEFSESKYISISVAAILQAMIVGAPVLVLSSNQPRTSYIVRCLLILVTVMSVLLLIMAPKAKALLSPTPTPSSSSKDGPSTGHSRWRSSTSYDGLKINTIKSLRVKFRSSNSMD